MRPHLLILAAAAVATTQGCATGRGTPPDGHGGEPRARSGVEADGADKPAPVRPSPETAARLDALYRARADSARARYHPADVHFMTGMIGHHGQALAMAGYAPENGASHSIRILCARIINAQKDEIAVMQRWLRERGRPVPEIHIENGRFAVRGPAHAMHMPGMLTAEQLDELRHAKGRDFDRLFLEYMIMHHEGAVTMVSELLATDGAAQGDFVFKLASDIQADQGSEIDRMQRMLDAMSPNPSR